MKDFPTIRLVGYDVDLSWLNLVNAALIGDPHLPVPTVEGPVISIPGGLEGQEFVVTLKPITRTSREKAFTVKPHPHSPDDIILFVPEEPVDPLKQRTGWLRKEILEAITKAFLSTRMPLEDHLNFESLEIDKDLEEAAARVQRKVTLAFGEAERALQPTDDLTVYFHPDLSKEQIEKSFAALADYYRACGGTGLRVEFEEQDVRVPEVAYDGRW